MKQVKVGTGAGFSGDRIAPAVDLAKSGEIDYLVFECLAERTIALAQLAKIKNAKLGYDPLLEARFKAVLPDCVKHGVKIITNMGAANPIAAGECVAHIAAQLGFHNLKIAVITGDDVQPHFNDCISANAYLGADALVEALKQQADIIITGRVCDPALFLAPLIYEFKRNDAKFLASGILFGHLLECAGQITGGYFADPPFKTVENLAHIGFPIGIFDEDCSITITKLENTGGEVTLQTVKEQLLYEIGDPSAYIQPDIIADFSKVKVHLTGKNRVKVTGASGKPAPIHYKVSVGYQDGFIGEGQISYAGDGAVARAQLAIAILKERLHAQELRFDMMGVNALHANQSSPPYEVRVRAVGRCETLEQAETIAHEVETLYTNGPAAGGGVTKLVKPVIAIRSEFIEKSKVFPKITWFGGTYGSEALYEIT